MQVEDFWTSLWLKRFYHSRILSYCIDSMPLKCSRPWFSPAKGERNLHLILHHFRGVCKYSPGVLTGENIHNNVWCPGMPEGQILLILTLSMNTSSTRVVLPIKKPLLPRNAWVPLIPKSVVVEHNKSSAFFPNQSPNIVSLSWHFLRFSLLE